MSTASDSLTVSSENKQTRPKSESLDRQEASSSKKLLDASDYQKRKPSKILLNILNSPIPKREKIERITAILKDYQNDDGFEGFHIDGVYKETGKTLLIEAVGRKGYKDLIKFLTSELDETHRPNINFNILVCANNGHNEIYKKLINIRNFSGASVESEKSDLVDSKKRDSVESEKGDLDGSGKKKELYGHISPLQRAILGNNNELVKYLTEKNEDVELKESNNMLALAYAALVNNEDAVSMLLETGLNISPDVFGQYPDYYADCQGHDEIKDRINDYKEKYPDNVKGLANIHSIFSRIEDNSITIEEKIKSVENAVKPYTKDKLNLVFENKHTLLTYLLKKGFYYFAYKLHEKFSEEIDLTFHFFLCVNNKHKRVLKLLKKEPFLLKPKQVKIKNDFLLQYTGYTTILHRALIAGNFKYAKKLIKKHKVNINQCDGMGQSPLIYLVRREKKDLVEIFKSNGADLDAVDLFGKDAFYYDNIWNKGFNLSKKESRQQDTNASTIDANDEISKFDNDSIKVQNETNEIKLNYIVSKEPNIIGETVSLEAYEALKKELEVLRQENEELRKRLQNGNAIDENKTEGENQSLREKIGKPVSETAQGILQSGSESLEKIEPLEINYKYELHQNAFPEIDSKGKPFFKNGQKVPYKKMATDKSFVGRKKWNEVPLKKGAGNVKVMTRTQFIKKEYGDIEGLCKKIIKDQEGNESLRNLTPEEERALINDPDIDFYSANQATAIRIRNIIIKGGMLTGRHLPSSDKTMLKVRHHFFKEKYTIK